MSFSPFGRMLTLAGHPSPALAQSPTALAPAPLVGEPPLDRVLSSVSPEEAADYQAWGQRERFLFLLGYQYLAVASAKNLVRPDGKPFNGFLPVSIDQALDFMNTAAPYLKDMSADQQAGADQATAAIVQARQKTEPQADDLAKKYRLLRDRVAWELATAGFTVEYEVVGDDPANPGVIYKRRVGEDKAADLSAIFSDLTPKQMFDAGVKLEDKYEELGVAFQRLEMSGGGRRLGAAGMLPILGIVIAVIVGILAFVWLFSRTTQEKKINETAIDLIMKDPNLSEADKAARIERLKSSMSFFETIFGTNFPWLPIIIGATVIGVAYFAIPALVGLFTSKPAYQPRMAGGVLL